MIITYDKTPGSPSQNSSESYVGYKDLGPRPVCVDCDQIECPDCGSDQPFQYPVVAGDLLYIQFNFPDNYNADPENPVYGWYGQDNANFYIQATLEFAAGGSLILNTQTIIRDQYVTYEDGSWQNIVLNTQRILEYIQTLGRETDCFRLSIQTFKIEPEDYLFVVSLGDSLPVVNPIWRDGQFAIVGIDIYVIVNGAWVSTGTQVQEGDVVLTAKTAQYYQLQSGEFVPYDPSVETAIDQTCTTSYYKFVLCEDTVLVEGVHGNWDCNGHYYGISESDTEAGHIAHRDRYRISAVLEPNAIRFENEEDEDGNSTTIKQWETWVLKVALPGLPYIVVSRLRNSLGAGQKYLNSNEFKNVTGFSKNNDKGMQWFSQVSCERLVCDNSGSCEDEPFFAPLIECPDTNCVDIPVTVLLNGEPYAIAPCGSTIDVISEGPSGGDVLVTNSDDTYSETVPCGDTLELEDVTYKFYLDGILQFTEVVPAGVDHTFNILP